MRPQIVSFGGIVNEFDNGKRMGQVARKFGLLRKKTWSGNILVLDELAMSGVSLDWTRSDVTAFFRQRGGQVRQVHTAALFSQPNRFFEIKPGVIGAKFDNEITEQHYIGLGKKYLERKKTRDSKKLQEEMRVILGELKQIASEIKPSKTSA